MEIKSVLIKELNYRVKILALNKTELKKELDTLLWPFSEHEYKTWVLDSFVLGINNITSLIYTNEEEKGSLLQRLDLIHKELYEAALDINPGLDPQNLFLTKQRKLTSARSRSPICKLKSWSKEEDFKEILDSDLQHFVHLNAGSKAFDHETVEEYFSLLNINIKIRQFDENDLQDIVKILDTESTTHLKYSVIAIGLVSFIETMNILKDLVDEYNVNLKHCLKELYRLVIKYNSFLYLHVEEARYLKKESKLLDSENFISLESFLEDRDRAEEEIPTKTVADLKPKEINDVREYLTENIYGQEDAINALCNNLELAYTGFKSPNKPIGAFLFYGPTSTGKTELAKLLAKKLRGSVKDGLIKIPCGTVLNMSHTIQTLIGAPPSYVGHDNKSLLSSNFTNKPNLKVLLFDEIDKAHEKVFDLLLEAADEGTLMDSSGNSLNLSEAILIFTCNTGQNEAVRASKAAGFKLSTDDKTHQNTIKKIYKDTISKSLKPEFLARLDGEFFFKRLEESDLIKTSSRYLNEFLKDWAAKYNINIEIQDSIFPIILANSKKQYGVDCHARHINNYIHKKIIKNLGSLFLTKKINPKDIKTLRIIVQNDEINFEILPKKLRKKSETSAS